MNTVVCGGEFRFSGASDTDFGEYTAAVDALFPAALAPYVLSVYAYSNYLDGGEALGYATTDGAFSCPARNADQLLSAYTPTYAYEFADENAPPAQADFGGLLTFPLGAYHTRSAIPVPQLRCFGFPPRIQRFEPGDDPLQDMRLYWTQFAKTGNPNVVGKPAWPAYNATSDLFQSLVPPSPVAISSFKYEHLCSVFGT